MPVTVAEDRKMNSNWSDHRQHHATGNQEMLNQIAMHFNMPNVGNSTQVFKDTIYLTQVRLTRLARRFSLIHQYLVLYVSLTS